MVTQLNRINKNWRRLIEGFQKPNNTAQVKSFLCLIEILWQIHFSIGYNKRATGEICHYFVNNAALVIVSYWPTIFKLYTKVELHNTAADVMSRYSSSNSEKGTFDVNNVAY